MEIQQSFEQVDLRKDTIPSEIKKYFFKDKQKPNLLKDYDVIGFDADHCMVKYNVKELVKFLIEIELQDFKELGYPEQITEFNYDNGDIEVCLNSSIFDIENGLIIKLVEGQEVIRAMRGFTQLSADQIRSVYGNPPIFRAYQWPNTTHLTTAKGGYWVFLTFFDTPKVAICLKALELKEKGLLPHKSYLDIANDIKTMVYQNYIHFNEREVHKIGNYGKYFPEVVKDPKRFIQYQPELRTTLQKLRDNGKKLFIASNSHVEYSDLIMRATLGEDWRSYFDIVCSYSRKPLFFWDQKPSPFYEYDPTKLNTQGKPIFEAADLKQGDVYTQGNSKLLTHYFERILKKSDVKTVFFGDQYITDVYASSTNPEWDAIAVVEELLFYDDSYSKGVDPQMIKYDKHWGKDTYFYEAVGDEKTTIKRSYFMSQLEDCARYIVPLVKNIDLLMDEEDS